MSCCGRGNTGQRDAIIPIHMDAQDEDGDAVAIIATRGVQSTWNMRNTATSVQLKRPCCCIWPLCSILYLLLIGAVLTTSVFTVKHGDFASFWHGRDTFGNVCGKDNRSPTNALRLDATTKPYLYHVFNNSGSVSVCVAQCPTDDVVLEGSTTLLTSSYTSTVGTSANTFPPTAPPTSTTSTPIIPPATITTPTPTQQAAKSAVCFSEPQVAALRRVSSSSTLANDIAININATLKLIQQQQHQGETQGCLVVVYASEPKFARCVFTNSHHATEGIYIDLFHEAQQLWLGIGPTLLVAMLLPLLFRGLAWASFQGAVSALMIIWLLIASLILTAKDSAYPQPKVLTWQPNASADYFNFITYLAWMVTSGTVVVGCCGMWMFRHKSLKKSRSFLRTTISVFRNHPGTYFFPVVAIVLFLSVVAGLGWVYLHAVGGCHDDDEGLSLDDTLQSIELGGVDTLSLSPPSSSSRTHDACGDYATSILVRAMPWVAITFIVWTYYFFLSFHEAFISRVVVLDYLRRRPLSQHACRRALSILFPRSGQMLATSVGAFLTFPVRSIMGIGVGSDCLQFFRRVKYASRLRALEAAMDRTSKLNLDFSLLRLMQQNNQFAKAGVIGGEFAVFCGSVTIACIIATATKILIAVLASNVHYTSLFCVFSGVCGYLISHFILSAIQISCDTLVVLCLVDSNSPGSNDHIPPKLLALMNENGARTEEYEMTTRTQTPTPAQTQTQTQTHARATGRTTTTTTLPNAPLNRPRMELPIHIRLIEETENSRASGVYGFGTDDDDNNNTNNTNNNNANANADHLPSRRVASAWGVGNESAPVGVTSQQLAIVMSSVRSPRIDNNRLSDTSSVVSTRVGDAEYDNVQGREAVYVVPDDAINPIDTIYTADTVYTADADANDENDATALPGAVYSVPEPHVAPQLARNSMQFTCKVCMDNDADQVLFPCKHLCLCASCVKDIREIPGPGRGKCPVCRTTFVSVTNIYVS